MIFDPLTEEQLQMANLLPDGQYNYQVVKAEDKVSKAGNEYTSLTLKVWDNEGKEHLVFTNLALIKLLKHFCDVNGLQDEYKSGNVPADLMLNKCSGKIIVEIEGEKPNPAGGFYKAKNVVRDYIGEAKPSSMKTLPEMKDTFSDEIPF